MNVAVAEFTQHSSSAYPHEPISRMDALRAQRAWSEMVIEIGEIVRAGGDYRAHGESLLRKVYDFDRGPVLLKPAFAGGHPIRTEFDDIASYYIGGGVWEDEGFARKPWRKIRFGRQFASFGQGSATLMGSCFLTPVRSAIETQIDFTMGFRRDPQGATRMTLHHSSVPFRPIKGAKLAA